ncbi:MAG: hypothetical protein GXY83_29355 [Rhodopirellula sp.]|nr:hypothetical protein [Rhodopirellula sp.]
MSEKTSRQRSREEDTQELSDQEWDDVRASWFEVEARLGRTALPEELTGFADWLARNAKTRSTSSSERLAELDALIRRLRENASRREVDIGWMKDAQRLLFDEWRSNEGHSVEGQLLRAEELRQVARRFEKELASGSSIAQEKRSETEAVVERLRLRALMLELFEGKPRDQQGWSKKSRRSDRSMRSQ